MVVSKMEIPTPHGAIPGKTQLSPTNYYNLDAITGKTAAEIVYNQADHTKENSNAITGDRIRQIDIYHTQIFRHFL